MGQPKIVYENESMLVVDKPSGWITDAANTTKDQPVLQKWIADNFTFPINDFEHRNGIVHRLDKETSGLLLIAKTDDALKDLQRQFKQRLVQKTYIALVHGDIKLIEGMIDEPVGRLPWRRDRFGVLPGGRQALTLYKVSQKYKNNDTHEPFTLLELNPKTGRTHQIRIHLRHLGHPIVGDGFYAGRKTAREDRKWCNRLFLHAAEIAFTDPTSKKAVNFQLSLPDELGEILDKLYLIT